MTGRREEARDELLDLQSIKGNKSQLQSSMTNLALCHQALGEAAKATEVAKKCIAIDSKSSLALQSQAVILEAAEDDEKRESGLYRLETRARARKAYTVANNLALERANRTKDLDHRSEILERLTEGARGEGDQYNAMRGLLKLTRTSISRSRPITHRQLVGLVHAYSYCHDQRIDSLFAQCHSVLWDIFEKTKETHNLLILFRQSSLIWRLRDQTTLEETYIGKLSLVLGPTVWTDVKTTDRDLAYFLSRGINLLSRTQISGEQPDGAKLLDQ
jgi:tetratricopeptide (TPR) repeat protein